MNSLVSQLIITLIYNVHKLQQFKVSAVEGHAILLEHETFLRQTDVLTFSQVSFGASSCATALFASSI